MNTICKLIVVIFFILFMQLFILEVIEAKEMEYPEKPIQFLVGQVAGSTTDLGARALSKIAAKYVEKPLVVVNMPGAMQTVAMNELAKSTPDGHTIGLMTSSYPSVNPHTQRLPFDVKVLKPLLGYVQFRHVIYVRADSPYAKLEEFIAYGQKNPGAIKFGHPGKGGVTCLQGLLFFKSANIKATDVPYKGSAEYIQAVIGGHIQCAIGDISGVAQYVRAGTLKPLVTFTDYRLKEVPEVPTSKEKGFADISALDPMVYIGIHRDTPVDRMKRLHDALKKTVEDPEFTKMFDDMGMKSGYVPPNKVGEIILKTENLVVPLLKELKLFIE